MFAYVSQMVLFPAPAGPVISSVIGVCCGRLVVLFGSSFMLVMCIPRVLAGLFGFVQNFSYSMQHLLGNVLYEG